MARSGAEILHTGARSASIFDLSRSIGEGVQIVDFCTPCNPYFPTPEMFDELSRELKNILKYYPSDSSTITNKLCSVLGLHPQTVAMANGSTELITWIDHLLIKSSIAIPIPTFGRWTDQPLETANGSTCSRCASATRSGSTWTSTCSSSANAARASQWSATSTTRTAATWPGAT